MFRLSQYTDMPLLCLWSHTLAYIVSHAASLLLHALVSVATLLWLHCYGHVVHRGHHAATVPPCPATTLVSIVTHQSGALCESVLLSSSESVLLSCSNSPSWPSRSRGLVSVVKHTRVARAQELSDTSARSVQAGQQHRRGAGRQHKRRPAVQVEALIEELMTAGAAALSVDVKAGATERLCAYARSVAHFPTAVKEMPWRNGWFADLSSAAVAAGRPDPCPLHSAGLSDVL